MSKLVKSITGIVLLVAMLGVGVWAITYNNVNFSGKVYFDFQATDVKVSGDVTQYSSDGVTKYEEIDTYSYNSSTAVSTTPNWNIPDIKFVKGAPIAIYTFTFTNIGNNDLEIDIVKPTLTSAALALSGSDITAATLASGLTVSYKYTLTLIDTAASMNEIVTFAVSVIEATP